MVNRTFLSLSGADGAADILATANDRLPLLWQLLLAGGTPAADATGAARLASDADAALVRLRCVVDFMARHPAVLARPALGWAFDGALASLRESVAARPGLRFGAALGELSWMADAAPADFADDCREDCNARWLLVADAIDARDHTALSRALYLDDPDDWTYWAWVFGFGTLSDPYFSGLEMPPDHPHPDAPLPRRNAWWRWFTAGS